MDNTVVEKYIIKGCSILIRKLDGLVNQIEKVTIKEAFTEKSKSMIDDVEEKKIKKKKKKVKNIILIFTWKMKIIL